MYFFILKKIKFKFQNSSILEFGPGQFCHISSNFIKIQRICEPCMMGVRVFAIVYFQLHPSRWYFLKRRDVIIANNPFFCDDGVDNYLNQVWIK
jgi:hypothetical protein